MLATRACVWSNRDLVLAMGWTVRDLVFGVASELLEAMS